MVKRREETDRRFFPPDFKREPGLDEEDEDDEGKKKVAFSLESNMALIGPLFLLLPSYDDDSRCVETGNPCEL